jgi:hypothetical protein
MLLHPLELKKRREQEKKKSRQTTAQSHEWKTTQDYQHFDSWRDIAAHCHDRYKYGDATLSCRDGVGAAYFWAVQKGFKGHMGEWIRTVENARQESSDSKVPKKILKGKT